MSHKAKILLTSSFYLETLKFAIKFDDDVIISKIASKYISFLVVFAKNVKFWLFNAKILVCVHKYLPVCTV